MHAVLSDISFFCFLFNITLLSSCKSGEKRESSTLFFAHERKAYCWGPPVQADTDEQRSHSASVEDKIF